MPEDDKRKKILTVDSGPPGWFALYHAYDYDQEMGEELRVKGFFAVPIAGWALCEDAESQEREIHPYFGNGSLCLKKSTYVATVFRPDWLHYKLNGNEVTLENEGPFDPAKNRLEIESRKSIHPGSTT